MNAILFLINEHNNVRKMFQEIYKGSHRDSTKKEMFFDLCQELIRHETTEQRIWYPYLKNNEKLTKTIKHLISEEKNADKLIKEFKKIKTQDEWDKKFLKFKKEIEHHATEEETKLFPKVAKILSKKELDDIGLEMFRFRRDFNTSLRKAA